MDGRAPPPGAARPLYATVFVIATCGLVYELVAGALSSYLLGDTITWFSLIIGTYLSAMGVGAWLSRYVERGVARRFVEIEIAVAVIGGLQSPILFAGFALTPAFRVVLLSVVFLVGCGVGAEIPLLIRILEREERLKDLVARVLFLDYFGALAASVLFPLLLVPRLGLLRTSIAVGLINAAVALWSAGLFDLPAPERRRLRALALAAIALLTAALLGASAYERWIESRLFADPVVLSRQTPYQRLTVTRRDPDTRLYIDGALQFSSVDEYRYHEALVHPAMLLAALPGQERRARVLILGGGDGLAAREVLRYPEVGAITLVDLDPQMTALFRDHEALRDLNGGSLSDPRLTVVNGDAFQWIRAAGAAGAADPAERYDAVIVDFPDPNHYGLGKLYTKTFYGWLRAAMAPGAALSIQAASPWWSPSAYACVVATVRASGFSARPYAALVPSFGPWGFILAVPGEDIGADDPIGAGAWAWRRPLPPGLRSLDAAALGALFSMPPDVRPREAPVNRLDNQILVQLYEQEWSAGQHARALTP